MERQGQTETRVERKRTTALLARAQGNGNDAIFDIEDDCFESFDNLDRDIDDEQQQNRFTYQTKDISNGPCPCHSRHSFDPFLRDTNDTPRYWFVRCLKSHV